MFKIQICGNFVQNCVVSQLFSPRTVAARHLKQINSVTSNAFPEKNREKDHRTQRPRFKGKTPFPSSSFNHSVQENQWNRSPPKESEHQFLVRVKNNPDSFGDEASKTEPIDEGDIIEEKRFTEQPSPHRRLRTKQYADMIKNYIHQRKLKEAIDVLEVKMIKEDRIKPENYIYNLLLGACGRVGYTKKAFMLYNDMKKRGLKVTGGTYTALFNACANSPWPETDGLSRAKHLYNIMIEKGDQPNDTNYNAMIKAFGRCNDLPMAFAIVDEMTQKGFPLKDDTFNFLLQACITDKDTGFRHSLLVWRKMLEKNVRPSVFTFNLMLRCVRDCGLGDLETTKDVIDRLVCGDNIFTALPVAERLELEAGAIQNGAERLGKINHQQSATIGTNITTDFSSSESQMETVSNVSKEVTSGEVKDSMDLRPNLLARKPHLGSILSLSEVTRQEDRLLLLGGCKEFLKTMAEHKCTPDVKTFSQLLDNLPSTTAAEKELIIAMKKLNVRADIDFYNMLIKKKSMRFDYEGAREVLTSMKQLKLRPDLITYGVLSLGCKTREEALDLVEQMKASGYTLNAAILGAMLKQACHHMKFEYIFEVMELCLKESVPVNKKFLGHLEMFKERLRAKLDAQALNKIEVKLFGIFKARYKTWLTEIQMDDTEEAHPWQQYRQTNSQDFVGPPKDSARFKARHTSKFKVKTSTKQRW